MSNTTEDRLARLEYVVEEFEDAIIGADDGDDVVSPMTVLARLAETIRTVRRVDAVERSGPTWGPTEPGRRTRQG